MAMERSRWRKLAKLMSDHVLGYVDGEEASTIVDGDRLPDHLWEDRRSSRPRFNGSAIIGALVNDLLHEVIVNERAFFYGSRQGQISRYG